MPSLASHRTIEARLTYLEERCRALERSSGIPVPGPNPILDAREGMRQIPLTLAVQLILHHLRLKLTYVPENPSHYELGEETP
jgi:hypothetical protein